MEMIELLKTWKRFGRPQTLADRNTKGSWDVYETDPFDEGLHMVSGWLRHRQSQQLLIVLALICALSRYFIHFSNLMVTSYLAGLTWENIQLLFLSMLPPCGIVMSALAVIALFPFKWDLLREEQTIRISKNLNMMTTLLLISVMVIPFVIPVTTSNIIASIILYAVDVDIIHVGEKIRGLTEMRRLKLSD